MSCRHPDKNPAEKKQECEEQFGRVCAAYKKLNVDEPDSSDEDDGDYGFDSDDDEAGFGFAFAFFQFM